MKTKVISIVLIVQTICVFSQNYQTVEEVNDACAQLGFAGNEDAEIAVDNILDNIGLSRNFVLVECPDINNAIAKNIEDGTGRKERYILYDGDFFTKIDAKAGNNWAATSVLAHEIGHHLNGHSLNDEGSNHRFELEADEFSGFVLARMGATLKDAQSAIMTLRYEKATRTHPAKADRLIAIEKGWKRGAGHAKIIEENIEVIDNPKTAEDVISNYIAAIGGKNKIGSIKTTSLFYEATFQGFELKMNVKRKYPNKYFSSIEMTGSIINKVVYDGSNGYSESMGTKTPLTQENIENLENNYLTSFGLDLARTGNLVGIENYNGTEVYVIEKNLSKHYFDTKTGLKVAETIGYKDVSGNVVTQTSVFEDYKSVNGILHPHKVIMKLGEQEMTLNLKEILIDEGVKDSDFN